MLGALANISWLATSQLEKVADALSVTRYERRSTIFSDKSSSEAAYILLSGVARISCDNRKGRRTLVIMVSPGLIPEFPPAVAGITYNFRCEAVTNCEVGAIGLNTFMKICLGISSASFKRMSAGLVGRWDRIHLRSSNIMGFTLEERLALALLDLSEDFGAPYNRGRLQLTVPVRHGDLAEMVGSSRSRVSEHLSEFMQKQLISLQDRRLVVDHEGLRAFLKESHRERLSGEFRN